jgi:ParB family transcriptional regulator, chromosome partitioning protein
MMVEKKRALGRGLDALLPAARAESPKATPQGAGFLHCPVEKLTPQKGQPRQHFDEEELAELTHSIREHGVLQPILVRRLPSPSGEPHRDRFEIIAGERRWRAAQKAGLHEVPVVVKDTSPAVAFELALLENIQRADLNPIEVAESYDRLIQEHQYSHDTLATRIGKERSTITNVLRLLKLPPRVRTLVISRELSEGHARALLGAPNADVLTDVAEKVIRGKLSVRKAEELIRKSKNSRDKTEAKDEKARAGKSAAVRDLETRLARRFGTRVEVRDADGTGEVAIHYGSLDELDRVLGFLGV